MNVFTLENKNILLVEDEPLVQDMYKMNLEKNGAQVAVVDSGEKAVDALQNNVYDLVILDRVLNGEMSGLDVLVEMRNELKLSDIPVVFLTNLDLEPANQELLKNFNVAGYYVKANMSLTTLAQIFSSLFVKN